MSEKPLGFSHTDATSPLTALVAVFYCPELYQMHDKTQEVVGATTSIGAFLASFPLSQINEFLTMIALVVSIVAGLYTIRKARHPK